MPISPAEHLGLRRIAAGYGSVPVVREVDLTVGRGEVVTIVGPNGAGKSTVLKAIVGILSPSEGDVTLGGERIDGLRTDEVARRGVGYVPQVRDVFETLTVRENLEMGGYIRASGVRERVEQLFELFPDLRDASRRRASTLSGGQRTMLAMGRGLMVDPVVLILDEPSAGLSPRFQGLVWERIEQVSRTGVAVLVVEQNTRETLRHARWAYVLVLGKNRLEGAGQDLLNDEEVVDLYIGRLS
jgi:ABC-type branched-subunit amino acid transport system ATPase component